MKLYKIHFLNNTLYDGTKCYIYIYFLTVYVDISFVYVYVCIAAINKLLPSLSIDGIVLVNVF